MLILAHWPGESRNYHVSRALILSRKIVRTYDNSPVVLLFHVIVVFFFSFYYYFFNNTSKQKRYKVKI